MPKFIINTSYRRLALKIKYPAMAAYKILGTHMETEAGKVPKTATLWAFIYKSQYTPTKRRVNTKEKDFTARVGRIPNAIPSTAKIIFTKATEYYFCSTWDSIRY